MKHTRTLQLEEDVLCVKFSPDHRLLVVSLLDCTVKIFYTDTLKVQNTCKNTHAVLDTLPELTAFSVMYCIVNTLIHSVMLCFHHN